MGINLLTNWLVIDDVGNKHQSHKTKIAVFAKVPMHPKGAN